MHTDKKKCYYIPFVSEVLFLLNLNKKYQTSTFTKVLTASVAKYNLQVGRKAAYFNVQR